MSRTALPLLLALTACSLFTAPDGRRGDVRLAVDRPEYSAGDIVRIHLRNLSDERIAYSQCGLAREQWTGGGWQRIERLWICTAVLQTLEPGEATTITEPITEEWAPGSYRMVIPIEFAGGTVVREVRSQILQVVR